jgi:tetratricopeptide (TPR) repeat protein
MPSIRLSLVTGLTVTLAATASAQVPDNALCSRLVDPARRAAARPRADAVIAAGGPAAEYVRGCLAWDEERSDAAIAAFERAVKGDPSHSDWWLWLGNAYGVKAQRANVFSQAMLARKTKAAFDRAVQLDGDNVEAREGLMQYYMLAPGVVGGSMEKAEAEARAIQQRNAYRGGFALARLAGRRKDAPAAERSLRGVLAAYPDSLDATTAVLNLLGAQGRWGEAWPLLDQAERRLAGDRRVAFWVGRTAALSGQQLERGERALTGYLAGPAPSPREPAFASAHFRLGQIQAAAGRAEAARASYRSALALNPRLAEAKSALKALGG